VTAFLRSGRAESTSGRRAPSPGLSLPTPRAASSAWCARSKRSCVKVRRLASQRTLSAVWQGVPAMFDAATPARLHSCQPPPYL
jgi:hypothetical protein